MIIKFQPKFHLKDLILPVSSINNFNHNMCHPLDQYLTKILNKVDISHIHIYIILNSLIYLK